MRNSSYVALNGANRDDKIWAFVAMLCASLYFLTSPACTSSPSQSPTGTGTSGAVDSGPSNPTPREIMDACGLPEPCEPAEYHLAPECYPIEPRDCVTGVLEKGQPAHVTVFLRDVAQLRSDVYLTGHGTAVIVNSHCDLDGIQCNKYDVEQCTIMPDPVCGSPYDWCAEFQPLDKAACP